MCPQTVNLYLPQPDPCYCTAMLGLDTKTLAPPRLRIGSDWVPGEGEAAMLALPIPGDDCVQVRWASAKQVEAAARAAESAAPAWVARPPETRAEALRHIADAIRAVGHGLAAIQTTEAAMPVSQAQLAVAHTADYLDGLAAMAPSLADETLPGGTVLSHLPLGPVAIVTSWNQGFANVAQAAGNALLAGCPVVLKPSERAPFTAECFAVLATGAGLPEGTVNLVHGGPATAAALAQAPGIAGLHLTGGLAAGAALSCVAAARGIPLNAELGGKSSLIVRADADLVAAAAHAVSGAVVLSGQGCANPTRIYVHAEVRRSFDRLLRGFLRRVVPGDPRDPDTAMGPLISADARARVVRAVAAAVEDGAGFLDPAMAPDPAKTGPWLAPVVLTDPPTTCEAAASELFGPILCLWSVADDDAAVEAANASAYGLAAYVHGGDRAATRAVAERLRAGTVWVNGVPPLPPWLPFGGLGASGDGRLGGVAGLRRFTRTRTVWSNE